MKKHNFEVGDLVVHKAGSHLGVGKIVNITKNYELAWIKWPPATLGFHDTRSLEFAETPIERMKRRYEENPANKG